MMKKHVLYIVILVSCFFCSTVAANDSQVIRRYYDDGMLKDFGANIILIGCPEHILKLTRWLDEIASVPKGFQTLWMISNSPHDLIIQDSEHALVSAGRTRAPMTMDLINGVGASVEILFDVRTGDGGSHLVFNAKNQLIEFPAIVNLYHELAHALHMMNGTWRYFASEDQAIEEENVFRRQLARQQGRNPTHRFNIDGIRLPNTGQTAPPKAIQR